MSAKKHISKEFMQLPPSVSPNHGGDSTLTVAEMMGDLDIHRSCYQGDVEHVDHLTTLYPALIESRNAFNETPVIAAGTWGQVKVVRLLRRKKANLSARDMHNRTVLMCVAAEGYVEVYRALTEGKRNAADPYERGPGGRLAAHFAAANGQYEIILRMRRNGERCDLPDEEGLLPLDLADEVEDAEARALTIKALVEPLPVIEFGKRKEVESGVQETCAAATIGQDVVCVDSAEAAIGRSVIYMGWLPRHAEASIDELLINTEDFDLLIAHAQTHNIPLYCPLS